MRLYRAGYCASTPAAQVIKVSAVSILMLLTGTGMVASDPPGVYTLTNARVVTSPGQVIESGTIVIRDGLIEEVGSEIEIPEDSAVIDLGGATVTAGFIDACTDIGQKSASPGGGASGTRGFGSSSRGKSEPAGPVHPISRVRPETMVADKLVTDENAFEKHRKIGFTTALTLPGKGILRGHGAVLNLGSGTPAENLMVTSAGQVIAFERGSFGQGYPTSLMGSIAAIRQTLLDARRYDQWEARYLKDPTGLRRPAYTAAYAALIEETSGDAPVIFDIDDRANTPRAIDLAVEFSLDTVLIVSGLESLEQGAIDDLHASGHPVIHPLNFPEDPKVKNPDEALSVTLETLREWDMAPGNPALLHEAGIPFALGTCRLENVTEFIGNVRKSIERGLPADTALAALTTVPATILGIERNTGTVEKGKIANLAVFEGATEDEGVFAEKAQTTYVFVDGTKYDIERKESKADPDAKEDPRGTWSISFSIGGRTISRTWVITGDEDDFGGTAETREGEVDFESVEMAGNELTVKMPRMGNIVCIISGDSLEGEGEFPGGKGFSITGKRTGGPEGGAL